MWNMWHDFGWGHWVTMSASMIVIWAAVLLAIVLVIRATGSSARHPERLLAERFAAGEIDEQEYRDRLQALRRA